MSKIEWERQPDGIIAGHADFVRYQAYEGEQETWQRIHDARIAALAAANGYVKAEDYEALKAKLAEVTDQLEDATSTLDQIEAESSCFDGLARSAGYVKLEPGQVVVNGEKLLYVLHNSKYPVLDDGTCTIDAAEELLRAIKEACDE